MAANQNSLVQKIVGVRNDQILKWLHSNSNRMPLLRSTLIHEYPEEGAKFSRKCQTWKNCCHSWSELISNNGEIGPRSRPYQPEAFGPSGPGCFFWAGYPKIFLSFCFFAQPPFLCCNSQTGANKFLILILVSLTLGLHDRPSFGQPSGLRLRLESWNYARFTRMGLPVHSEHIISLSLSLSLSSLARSLSRSLSLSLSLSRSLSLAFVHALSFALSLSLLLSLPGDVRLVGPQEELRYPSGYTPRGFTSSPGREKE